MDIPAERRDTSEERAKSTTTSEPHDPAPL